MDDRQMKIKDLTDKIDGKYERIQLLESGMRFAVGPHADWMYTRIHKLKEELVMTTIELEDAHAGD